MRMPSVIRTGVAGTCAAMTAALLTGAPGDAATAYPGHRNHPPAVHLIVDTDIYSDVDDTGALAIANAAQQRGDARLLGVMVDTPSRWGAPAADAIDTYYHHPNVPIGTLKPGDDSTFDKNYAQYLAQHFPNSLRDGERAPEATALYRRILAGQPDHSVTIAAVGPLTNLAKLLNSGPDRYSRLDGDHLVARKVRRLVVMGGQYPSGKEFNFDSDPAATARVVGDWPTRTVFDGFEVGATIMTGSQISTRMPAGDPVRKAYEIYVGHGNDRSSWDPSTVYYAIYGRSGLFALADETGSNEIAADGSNQWATTPDKNQAYLVKRADDTTIAAALSRLETVRPHGR